MERQSKSPLNEQIYEEACEWFIEFRSGAMDAERLREADRWLRKSPEQLSAYLEIAAIWTDGPSLVTNNEYPLAELISGARLEHRNVIAFKEFSHERVIGFGRIEHTGSTAAGEAGMSPPMETIFSSYNPWPQFSSYPFWRMSKLSLVLSAACAAAACIALCAGLVWYRGTLNAPTIATEVGEQRSFLLEDGSTVSLNSRSRIRVRYSEHARDVQLIEGQALFHVAKDGSRPFIVEANGTKVRAVGTEFDVYEKSSGTFVTVIEGRVAILTEVPLGESPSKSGPDSSRGAKTDSASVPTGLLFSSASSGSGGNILLGAGEQLSVTEHRAQKIDHADLAKTTAWTHRELVFEFATLAEVAEEFNRYNKRPLVIAEPGLDTFHITGMFSSTDPAAIIRFLRARPGLQVVETDSAIHIERKSS